MLAQLQTKVPLCTLQYLGNTGPTTEINNKINKIQLISLIQFVIHIHIYIYNYNSIACLFPAATLNNGDRAPARLSSRAESRGSATGNGTGSKPGAPVRTLPENLPAKRVGGP